MGCIRFRSETDTTPRQSGTPRLLIAGISGTEIDFDGFRRISRPVVLSQCVSDDRYYLK